MPAKKMSYYRGRRRRHFRRMPRMKFGWLNVAPTALTAASGSEPEPTSILLKGVDMYPSSGVKVLDWSPGARYLLERVVLSVAITVTTFATKALLRVLFGMRLVNLDANDNVGSSYAYPSLQMADEDDTRTDWLWTGSDTIQTLGDNTQVYTTANGVINLDFKPKRWLARDMALVFQYRPVYIAGGSGYPDAVFGVNVSGKLGFLAKAALA